MGCLHGLAGAALLALCLVGRGEAQDQSGAFDFYVLALSWSPTWCAGEEGRGDSDQCRAGAGFRFIVHGLWPQHESGFPQSCATREPQRVPRELAARMLDIMPDLGLVFSQWRKHGTCTGLAQGDYFAAVRAAAERVTVPPELASLAADASLSAEEIERLFRDANPDLGADEIAIACEAGALEEVRICLTRDLGFRGCKEVDRRGCRKTKLQVPAPS